MKKTLLTLALAGAVASSYGQGYVTFANATRLVTINTTAGGASAGSMPANNGTAGQQIFYFALYYSASATTVAGSGAGAVMPTANTLGTGYVFSDSNWTFDNPSSTSGYIGAAYATNSAAAGKFASTVQDPNSSGQTLLPFGTAAQFVVVGWSALTNAGTAVTTVAQLLAWYNAGGPALANGWLGETIVSSPIIPSAGGLNPTQPLFGAVGGGLLNAFTLGVVPVPEPSTIALAGLGGLSLLLFRRRK